MHEKNDDRDRKNRRRDYDRKHENQAGKMDLSTATH